MIKKDNKHLLFIEPSDNRTIEPIIDHLTRKITASLRAAKKGIFEGDGSFLPERNGGWFFGSHRDACGCSSDSTNYLLNNGRLTNSLAIHYVAFHRWELTEDELTIIDALDDGQEEPTDKELWP